MINEPDVSLTDFALAVECAVLCGLMQRRRGGHRAAEDWASAFFGSIGLAALAGGSMHGFFPDPKTMGHALLWQITLVAIGAAGMSAWAMGAYLMFSSRVARWIVWAAVAEFALYGLVVALLAREFTVAISNYLPAVIFLLVAAIVDYHRRGTRAALVGATGIVLTFVASFVQTARLAIHPVYFDHNAFYHIIQGIALYLVFRWTSARRLPNDGCGGNTT